MNERYYELDSLKQTYQIRGKKAESLKSPRGVDQVRFV